MHPHSRVAENLESVLSAMSDACRRAGRAVDDVRLVAVTKYAAIEHVRSLVSLGQRELGESRPQQLCQRALELSDRAPGTPQDASGRMPSLNWHLIGHLQRNKVESVLPVAALIHSVDSLRLLARIDAVAGRLNLRPRVLLEVNVSGEASKDGFPEKELRSIWFDVCAFHHVELRGLMTMAPQSDTPEEARPCFRSLRGLRDELVALSASAGNSIALPELSMGMSDDFTVAIEEGATLVRIGSRLFHGLESQT